MTDRKTPRIRFKGFTDDWEQRKVGELTNVLSASRVHKEEWAEDGVPFFRSSDVVSAFKGTENEKAFISVELYELLAKSSGKLEQNDILITGGGSIGIPYIVPDNKPLYSKDADLIWIKHSANFDSIYLYTYFMSEESREYLASISHTGTIAHYTIEQVKDTPVRLPSIDEQREIGAYFKSLDTLITLHQRECERFQIVKKSMLENMFPKNGERVPRIRFSGFTDDWEQRKLGDLYTERNERGNGSLQILSVSIHTGVSDGELDVDNLGKFVRRSEDKSTYKHVHSGDLIFNMMRAWQGAIGVAKTEGMISPAYISAIPSEDIYPPFMNYLLRRKNVINQINNLSYGVTDFRKRLYWNSFVQVNCKLPSVEEQRNITDVFEKIDNLITLHQRELEKLKSIKKSMLDKMFI